MIQFFVRYRRPIFIGTIATFLIGTFVGLGGYLLTDRDAAGSVAQVGGEKIPQQRYDLQVRNLLDRAQQKGGEVSKDMEARIRQDVLRDLIVEALFASEGKKVGLTVTDREVADDIRATFSPDGKFNQAMYFQAVQNQFQMTPEQYEDMRRKSLLAFKYRQLVQRSVKLTPQEVEEAYKKSNDGSMKGFDKKADELRGQLQQQKSLEMLNYILKQVSATTPIKSFLQGQ